MYSYYKRLKPTWYHVVCFNAFTKSLHKSALNSVHFANNALFGEDGRSRAKECSQHETIVFCVYMHVDVFFCRHFCNHTLVHWAVPFHKSNVLKSFTMQSV